MQNANQENTRSGLRFFGSHVPAGAYNTVQNKPQASAYQKSSVHPLSVENILKKDQDGNLIIPSAEEIAEAEKFISREWDEAEQDVIKAQQKIALKEKETRYLKTRPRRFNDPRLQKMKAVLAPRYFFVASLSEKGFFRMLLGIFEKPENINLARAVINVFRNNLDPEDWQEIMKIVTGGNISDI